MTPSGRRIKRQKVVEWTLAYVAFGYALRNGVHMLREAFEWLVLVPRLGPLGGPVSAESRVSEAGKKPLKSTATCAH